MKTINFKDFKRDYKEYYGDKNEYILIKTEEDMQEILFELYDTDKFDIDYENKVIELY